MSFARRSDAVRTTSSVPLRVDSCCPSMTRTHSFGFTNWTWTCPVAGNTCGRDEGLNGAIEVAMIASTCGSTIGPRADIEYEVGPVGVAMVITSVMDRSHGAGRL